MTARKTVADPSIPDNPTPKALHRAALDEMARLGSVPALLARALLEAAEPGDHPDERRDPNREMLEDALRQISKSLGCYSEPQDEGGWSRLAHEVVEVACGLLSDREILSNFLSRLWRRADGEVTMSNAPDAFREVSRRLLKKPDPGLLLRLNGAQETLEAVRADLAELSGLDLHRSLGDHLDAIRDKVAPTRHIRDRRYHSPSPFIRPGGDSHE